MKFFVAHNSCFNSSYDLNIVKEGLRRQGHELVNDPSEADEIIFSGCAAHATWVNDAINQIKNLTSIDTNKKFTVTGCIVGIDADKVKSQVDGNLNFRSQKEIVDSYTNLNFDILDSEYSQDDTLEFEGEGEFNTLRKRVGKEKLKVVFELDRIDREFGTNLVRLYKSMTKGFVFYNEDEPVEFITVSRSCLYNCSFCSIPKGRGDYTSVPLESILNKAELALKKGIRKLTLIGDEVGNYGIDTGKAKLANLVESILGLDENIRIGIRYIEPTPFLRHYDMFEKLCTEGRIYLLYVPLQTGSQKVLRDMNRNYNLELIAEKYRKLNLATDTVLFCNWMVGFPTETEADFQETINLAKYINFHISSAIPYSERPGTKAPLLPDKVPNDIIFERLERLRNILAKLKVERFRARLDFLGTEKANEILEAIELAEMVAIKETPNPVFNESIPVN